MMKQLKNKNIMRGHIIILIVLFFCPNSFAQIGIGTENPDNGIEVEGSVRFRNLKEGDLKQFNREVLMSQQGDLGYLEIESDRSYFVKMVSSKMTDVVVLDKTDQSKDLKLEIQLELLPNAISVFKIHYNIPFSFQTSQESSYTYIPLVSEVGVRLMKKQEAMDDKFINVKDGNRSISLISEYEKTSFELEYRSSFIEAMTIQEVINTSNQIKKITYKLMSYSKDNIGLLNFGSKADSQQGKGMIMIKVYHKPYYGEINKF